MRWNCTDEPGDAWIHRPLAGLLVRRLERTPVTADHLTLLSCGLGVCGAIYLGLGHPLAALLIVAHLVFDCADGQLARLRGPSRHGRWLDGLSDGLVGVAFYLGLLARGLPLPALAAAGASLMLRGTVFDGLKALYKGAADIPVYTPFQKRLVGPDAVRPAFLRLAGLGGVTTHHGILAISALFGDYDLFLVYAVVVANLQVGALLAMRYAASSRAAKPGPAHRWACPWRS